LIDRDLEQYKREFQDWEIAKLKITNEKLRDAIRKEKTKSKEKSSELSARCFSQDEAHKSVEADLKERLANEEAKHRGDQVGTDKPAAGRARRWYDVFQFGRRR
jgi:rRNA maturation protein Rpf1